MSLDSSAINDVDDSEREATVGDELRQALQVIANEIEPYGSKIEEIVGALAQYEPSLMMTGAGQDLARLAPKVGESARTVRAYSMLLQQLAVELGL